MVDHEEFRRKTKQQRTNMPSEEEIHRWLDETRLHYAFLKILLKATKAATKTEVSLLRKNSET